MSFSRGIEKPDEPDYSVQQIGIHGLTSIAFISARLRDEGCPASTMTGRK
jgi:hypothetical protein